MIPHNRALTALHYAMWGNQSCLFLLPPIILLGTSLSISWVEAHNRDILIQHRSTTGSFYHRTSPSTAASECLYTPIPPASLSSQYMVPTSYLKQRENNNKKEQRWEGNKKNQKVLVGGGGVLTDRGTEKREK